MHHILRAGSEVEANLIIITPETALESSLRIDERASGWRALGMRIGLRRRPGPKQHGGQGRGHLSQHVP